MSEPAICANKNNKQRPSLRLPHPLHEDEPGERSDFSNTEKEASDSKENADRMEEEGIGGERGIDDPEVLTVLHKQGEIDERISKAKGDAVVGEEPLLSDGSNTNFNQVLKNPCAVCDSEKGIINEIVPLFGQFETDNEAEGIERQDVIQQQVSNWKKSKGVFEKEHRFEEERTAADQQQVEVVKNPRSSFDSEKKGKMGISLDNVTSPIDRFEDVVMDNQDEIQQDHFLPQYDSSLHENTTTCDSDSSDSIVFIGEVATRKRRLIGEEEEDSMKDYQPEPKMVKENCTIFNAGKVKKEIFYDDNAPPIDDLPDQIQNIGVKPKHADDFVTNWDESMKRARGLVELGSIEEFLAGEDLLEEEDGGAVADLSIGKTGPKSFANDRVEADSDDSVVRNASSFVDNVDFPEPREGYEAESGGGSSDLPIRASKRRNRKVFSNVNVKMEMVSDDENSNLDSSSGVVVRKSKRIKKRSRLTQELPQAEQEDSEFQPNIHKRDFDAKIRKPKRKAIVGEEPLLGDGNGMNVTKNLFNLKVKMEVESVDENQEKSDNFTLDTSRVAQELGQDEEELLEEEVVVKPIISVTSGKRKRGRPKREQKKEVSADKAKAKELEEIDLAKGRMDESYVHPMDEDEFDSFCEILAVKKVQKKNKKVPRESEDEPEDGVYEAARIVGKQGEPLNDEDRVFYVEWCDWNPSAVTTESLEHLRGSPLLLRVYLNYEMTVKKIIAMYSNSETPASHRPLPYIYDIHKRWLADAEWEKEKSRKDFNEIYGMWKWHELASSWNKVDRESHPDREHYPLYLMAFHAGAKLPKQFKYITMNEYSDDAALRLKRAENTPLVGCTCTCEAGCCKKCDDLEYATTPNCRLEGNRMVLIDDKADDARSFEAVYCSGDDCPRNGEKCSDLPKREFPLLVAWRPAVKGVGVYAMETIPRYTIVNEYRGNVITKEEADDGRTQNYQFSVAGQDLVIDAVDMGNETRFINHCCEPNCGLLILHEGSGRNVPKLYVVTLKDIEQGEELTLDYHPSYSDGIKRKRPKNASKCCCGATKCRGFV